MRPSERRESILQALNAERRVLVDDLSTRLHCSRETLRRDLKELSLMGLVRKFHGGAELPAINGENPFQVRMTENAGPKQLIGECCAELFRGGESILIDTGTTTLYFAQALARRGEFNVITNSSSVAETLSAPGRRSRVFLLGGEYNSEASETLGTFVIEQIHRFRAEHVVLTVGAMDAQFGVTDYSLEEAQVARAMLAQAQSCTVIADTSKLGRTALFEVCPLDGFDRLVVERAPAVPLEQALKRAGVECIVAGGP